jgi:long-chain-fatty-acid--[acyl-carrier-protein] ligase
MVCHYILIGLRYKIVVKGHDNIDIHKTDPEGGTLFLSNHPSHLDGTLVSIALGRSNHRICIWALDDTFKNPYIKSVTRNSDVVTLMTVPNIYESRKGHHNKKLRHLLHRTVALLKQGRNVMFFPGGSQKHQGYEEIHGKSAIQKILHQYPNVNIIIIRIAGMWGSRFSKAVKKDQRSTTKGENLKKFAWNLCKIILSNLIFLIPRRKVVIEFMDTHDFPRKGTRKEMNAYIESKINEGYGLQGEPVLQVSDYFWKTSYAPIEYHRKNYRFSLEKIPPSIVCDVVSIVANKAKVDPAQIELDMKLERDLALDSLEVTEILIMLEKKYHLSPLLPKQVDSVGHLAAIVARVEVDYHLIEQKSHHINQEIAFPVRICQACATFIAAFFGFIETQR